MNDAHRSQYRNSAHPAGPRTHCPACGSVVILTQDQSLQRSQNGLALRCSDCSAQWAIRVRDDEDPQHDTQESSGVQPVVASSNECELVVQATRPSVPDGWLVTGESDNVAAVERLSPRERDVLSLLVQGEMNKQIGKSLGISEKTVEKHRYNIKRKLKVRSTVDVVRIAVLAELAAMGCLATVSQTTNGEPEVRSSP